MIHKIKALGLAFVAVFAMSALAASATQAAGLDHTGGNSVILTGQNTIGGVVKTHKLVASGIEVLCQQATLEGTITGQNVTESEVLATYGNCTAFGTNATVQMNGCRYTLKETATTTADAGVTGCTAGKTIQVATGICTLDIGNQTKDFSHVVFSNPNAQDIIAKATAGSQVNGNGIHYQETGAFCPHGNLATRSDAEFQGESTIQAFEEGASEQVTLHGHQYTRNKCGALVSLQIT